MAPTKTTTWPAIVLAVAICGCSDTVSPERPGSTTTPPADLSTWEQEIDSHGGAVYYLDPHGGSLANPGTREAPRPGLAEVLDADLIQRWEPVDHP